MSAAPPKARDLALLDAVDAYKREVVRLQVWRVAREARDPVAGSATQTRWCNGTFDVLYTSETRDGAVAEVNALLASQPVRPSQVRWFVHRLSVQCGRVLRLADMQQLKQLGVEPATYRHRDYTQTQAIADAAYFLDFDGMIVPSARWNCSTVIVFTDRVDPSELTLDLTESSPIDRNEWRARFPRADLVPR